MLESKEDIRNLSESTDYPQNGPWHQYSEVSLESETYQEQKYNVNYMRRM